MASPKALGYLLEVLDAAPPSHLAHLLLDLKEGRIGAIHIGTDGDYTELGAEEVSEAVRRELDDRLQRSRAHVRRGT